MDALQINWLAVLVAGVINMIVGAIWYAPAVFGTIWAKEIGMKMDAKMDPADMGKSYGITFIGALLMGFVTAAVVGYSNATTFGAGVLIGLLLWLGFAVSLPLNDVVFGKKTVTLYLLNAAYYIVVLVINGGMLAIWR